jgi:flagellar assembly protein FliH
LKAYERWQFASLADEAPVRKAGRNPEPEAPAGPTTAELAAHELAVLRETARADGHTAGFAAGRSEGLEAAALEVEHLRRIAAAMAAALSDLQDETARALLDLALDTARHVLRDELRTQPESMLGAVREAIDLAGAGAAPVLLLNPADIGFVQRQLGDEIAPGGWRLAEDSRIEPGGCRVTTTNGSIDATLKTRWQRAMASMGRDDAWNNTAAQAPAAKRAAPRSHDSRAGDARMPATAHEEMRDAVPMEPPAAAFVEPHPASPVEPPEAAQGEPFEEAIGAFHAAQPGPSEPSEQFE